MHLIWLNYVASWRTHLQIKGSSEVGRCMRIHSPDAIFVKALCNATQLSGVSPTCRMAILAPQLSEKGWALQAHIIR